MIVDVTELCDIYTRLWCVYEMHEAQKLKKKVTLCPHTYDIDVECGHLQQDVCISNIETEVGSKNAYCGQPSDKKDIHGAIRKLQNGFDGINASVERIWLEYLLNYPVDKVKGRNWYSEAEQKADRRKAAQLLASSIIVMVNRVHSLNDDVPDFNEFLEAQPDSSEPIDVFIEWKNMLRVSHYKRNKQEKWFYQMH